MGLQAVRKFFSQNKAPLTPQPEQTPDLETLLAQLPEKARRQAIIGAVQSGISTLPEHRLMTLAYIMETTQSPYTTTAFALKHDMPERAVHIAQEFNHYAMAIEILLDQEKLENAIALFPQLATSEGFFNTGKLYEQAADLAKNQNKLTTARELYTQALDAYRKDHRENDEVDLAHKLGTLEYADHQLNHPGRAIDAHLALAEHFATSEGFSRSINLDNYVGAMLRAREEAKYNQERGDQICRAAIEKLREINALNKALPFAQKLGDKKILEQIYVARGEYPQAAALAEERGDIDTAIEYLKQVHTGEGDAAAKFAEKKGRHAQAVELYIESGDTTSALKIASRECLDEQARTLAQKIVTGHCSIKDKVGAYEAWLKAEINLNVIDGMHSLCYEVQQVCHQAIPFCAENGDFFAAAFFTNVSGDKKTARLYEQLAELTITKSVNSGKSNKNQK